MHRIEQQGDERQSGQEAAEQWNRRKQQQPRVAEHDEQDEKQRGTGKHAPQKGFGTDSALQLDTEGTDAGDIQVLGAVTDGGERVAHLGDRSLLGGDVDCCGLRFCKQHGLAVGCNPGFAAHFGGHQ